MNQEQTMHKKFMREAILEAKKGASQGGEPIGAILVREGKIIGRGHNQYIQKKSAILHAEMDCIENAGQMNAQYYEKCTLYTTLSPCDMCSGAILLHKIPVVVIGENENYKGPEKYLKKRGIKLVCLKNKECENMLAKFIKKKPAIWKGDVVE